jgi:hypothetical protein
VVQRLHGSCTTPRWVVWLNLNLSLAVVFVLMGASGRAADVTMANGPPKEPLAGGDCTYNRYPGEAEVVAIRSVTMPGDNAPSYPTREVWFEFHPDGKIQESWVQIDDKQFLLTLSNGGYPGPTFLNKNGIDIGTRLVCELAVITKGTCSPILFEFPTLDLTDSTEFNN